MRFDRLVVFGTIACAPLLSAAPPVAEYGQIFAGDNWISSDTFLNWATPLQLHDSGKMECSQEIRRRISKSANNVLFCEQVGTLESDENSLSPKIVWAIIKLAQPSAYGHDCNAGIIYLDSSRTIIENSPATCDYVVKIEDPADVPIAVFQVTNTGALGIVFDGHGAECAGRAVLVQKANSFERVHELYWRCSQ